MRACAKLQSLVTWRLRCRLPSRRAAAEVLPKATEGAPAPNTKCVGSYRSSLATPRSAGETIDRSSSANTSPALILLLVLTGLLLPLPSLASPWGRERGEIFLSSKSNYFVATAPAPAADAAGGIRFERIDADIYAEWGAGFGLTAGGKALWGSSTFFDGYEGFSASGVTEFEGYLQKRLAKSKHDAFSIRIAGAKPTRFQSGARPGFASDGADAELRLLYGRDLILKPLKIFGTAEAGYRRRFGPGADQVRADALVGFERGRGLFLIEAQTTTSVGRAEPGGTRYDLVRLQATAVYRFGKRMSFQIGGAHEAAGKGLLRGDSVFAGFWARF